MARMNVTVCDNCMRVGVATKAYRITSEGVTVGLDLCKDHSQPLEALLGRSGVNAGAEGPAKAKAPARRRSGARVTTLAEIEESKK